jgi:xanthosine utilization system XapX-like protein
MHKNENKPTDISPATPRPVFMRMLMLFGSAAGCLLVGVVVSTVTGDMIMLAMSAILGIAFSTKGVLLKRKISAGQICSVSGVCISIVPKILGRYRRIELVDIDTGDDVSFILPKKITFKIGHIYTCYFDNQISSSPLNINNSGMDLPANGFLGFEDFGVYQEKPSVAAQAVTVKEESAETENNAERNKEEQL